MKRNRLIFNRPRNQFGHGMARSSGKKIFGDNIKLKSPTNNITMTVQNSRNDPVQILTIHMDYRWHIKSPYDPTGVGKFKGKKQGHTFATTITETISFKKILQKKSHT